MSDSSLSEFPVITYLLSFSSLEYSSVSFFLKNNDDKRASLFRDLLDDFLRVSFNLLTPVFGNSIRSTCLLPCYAVLVLMGLFSQDSLIISFKVLNLLAFRILTEFSVGMLSYVGKLIYAISKRFLSLNLDLKNILEILGLQLDDGLY